MAGTVWRASDVSLAVLLLLLPLLLSLEPAHCCSLPGVALGSINSARQQIRGFGQEGRSYDGPRSAGFGLTTRALFGHVGVVEQEVEKGREGRTGELLPGTSICTHARSVVDVSTQ